jgi:hypothetical protein
VFGEAHGRFAFKLRGFRLEKECLSFYIKPADGLQLPAIMQWVKQTFAVRFNRRGGRTGHVWGDRYWSRVLEGDPPEEAGEVLEGGGCGGRDGSAVFQGVAAGWGQPPAAENPAEPPGPASASPW